jgi:hypothetical protein
MMSEGVQVIPDEIIGNTPLVHRILLMDPEDFPSLTTSGHPPMFETPPYDAFASSLKRSEGERDSSYGANVNALVKGAFRDKVCESIATNHDWSGAVDLLVELHNFIRKLVPSRTDLHGYLDDGETQKTQTIGPLKALILKAAGALQSLESPARTESTAAWIQKFSCINHEEAAFQASRINSVVNSLLYLLFKAELCETDKQNYFLSTVWAPILHTSGPRLERLDFEKEYGPLSSPTTAPATREWIESIVKKQSDAEISGLLASKWSRWNLIRAGWIEEILFRASDSSSLRLPEILSRDAGRLQGLRHVTRLAAAGSALALLACQAAGQSSEVLNETHDESALLKTRRQVLVQTMSEHYKSPQEYEHDIANSVADIARIWKPNLDVKTIEGLLHRTRNVLKTEDPVIKLLDSRMKECFRELVAQISPESVVPFHMYTGAATNSQAHTPPDDKIQFSEKAQALFISRGLTFYASDLSNAARTASRVIGLALRLYGEDLIDQMILDACRKDHRVPGDGRAEERT